MSGKKRDRTSHPRLRTAPDMVRRKLCCSESETKFKKLAQERNRGSGDPLPLFSYGFKSKKDGKVPEVTPERGVFFVPIFNCLVLDPVTEEKLIGFVNSSKVSRSTW